MALEPTNADGEALDGEALAPDFRKSARYEIMQRARKTRAEEHGLTVEEGAEGEDEGEGAGAGAGIQPKGDEVDKLVRHEDGGEEGEKPKPAEGDKGAADDKGTPAEGGTSTPAIADDTEVEVKVNGKVQKLKWSEAKKHLQIGLATEDTLAEAKRRKDEADAELRAARAARAVIGEPARQEPARQEPTAAEKARAEYDAAKTKVREARKKFAEATQYGTPEEIEAATTKLSEAEDLADTAREKFSDAGRVAPAPQADPLVEREGIDTEKASRAYAENYKKDREDRVFNSIATMNLREEITKDLTALGADESMLAKLTDNELGVHHFKARSRGLVRTMDQVFTAAGNRAREELKARTSSGTPPRSAVEERQQRKSATTPPPRVAAGRVPEGEEAMPLTGAELAAEHRRRRGKA